MLPSLPAYAERRVGAEGRPLSPVIVATWRPVTVFSSLLITRLWTAQPDDHGQRACEGRCSGTIPEQLPMRRKLRAEVRKLQAIRATAHEFAHCRRKNISSAQSVADLAIRCRGGLGV